MRIKHPLHDAVYIAGFSGGVHARAVGPRPLPVLLQDARRADVIQQRARRLRDGVRLDARSYHHASGQLLHRGQGHKISEFILQTWFSAGNFFSVKKMTCVKSLWKAKPTSYVHVKPQGESKKLLNEFVGSVVGNKLGFCVSISPQRTPFTFIPLFFSYLVDTKET